MPSEYVIAKPCIDRSQFAVFVMCNQIFNGLTNNSDSHAYISGVIDVVYNNWLNSYSNITEEQYSVLPFTCEDLKRYF